MTSRITLALKKLRAATSIGAVVLFLCLASSHTQAGLTADVQEVLIGIIDQRTAGVTEGFGFTVEIDGTSITAITLVTPASTLFPSGETLTESDFDNEGETFCLDVVFPSLAALDARFTTGNYSLTVNGMAGSLNFNPSAPNGAISVTFPANGSSTPNGQPTFTTTNTCTNCNLVESIVEDSVESISIETFALSPTPLPSSFPFSAFGPNQGSAGPITALPLATPFDFCALSSVIGISTEMLGGVDSFTYVQERGNDDRVTTTVTTPTLASDIEEAVIEYNEVGGEWFFAASVEGAGISSGMVIPPNQPPMAFFSNPPDEFGVEVGPFVDEPTLRAAHPPSGADRYVFVIDGGERFYSASFEPGVTGGGVSIDSPLNGATDVSSTPSFTVTNACTNCDIQFMDVVSVGNFDVSIEVSFQMPFPTTIDFQDFDPNQGLLGPISELPPGDYAVEFDSSLEVFAPGSFTPTDIFAYFSGVFREDNIAITVPEVGTLLSQLFAGLTMVALRSARQRRRS